MHSSRGSLGPKAPHGPEGGPHSPSWICTVPSSVSAAFCCLQGCGKVGEGWEGLGTPAIPELAPPGHHLVPRLTQPSVSQTGLLINPRYPQKAPMPERASAQPLSPARCQGACSPSTHPFIALLRQASAGQSQMSLTAFTALWGAEAAAEGRAPAFFLLLLATCRSVPERDRRQPREGHLPGSGRSLLSLVPGDSARAAGRG